MASKLPRPVIPTLIAVLALGGWEWFVRAGHVNDVLVPAPSHILLWFWEALLSGELLSATWVTMRRLVIGFAIGAALGVHGRRVAVVMPDEPGEVLLHVSRQERTEVRLLAE